MLSAIRQRAAEIKAGPKFAAATIAVGSAVAVAVAHVVTPSANWEAARSSQIIACAAAAAGT